ncbi:MAG TPA: PD-(D/E)XK nuclease family protein [Candidatus Udaeobacter sp.]|nr:PD-(D/E)XK nuclease family protein [Candidatus Udaeobacter sp.]
MPDKYTATWVSHTSMSDFLRCPRAYYLKNIYKDPKTNHKIKLISPALALGQAVHEVLESLSVLPKQSRFSESLIAKLEKAWTKVSGKNGGFTSPESEYKYKTRGQDMLRRVMNNPGPLSGLAVKIQMDLPQFWLSEEDGIILCGKIDWLEYLPDTDSVHIIDFKTGKAEEDPESLQLPIYHLLVSNCQKYKASKASYWYLDSNDNLTPKELPDLEAAHKAVLAIARQVKLARQLQRFKCPAGEEGCGACRPMEAIFNRQAEFVGVDEYKYDVYMLNYNKEENREGILL